MLNGGMDKDVYYNVIQEQTARQLIPVYVYDKTT